MCHNDLHEGNLLVDDASGHWELTGLIDVENALAADPLLDLAKTDCYSIHGDRTKTAGLVAGYGLDLDAVRRRFDLYRVFHTLELWDWFHRIGRTEPLPGLLRQLSLLVERGTATSRRAIRQNRLMSTTTSDLTRTVLARHENVPDARLREIIRSLITHLHAFATEVGLTQDEWNSGIEFLTAAGHITDENRQEFILLSDTLGLSMLVDVIDHRTDQGETESTVLGPFWVADAPWRDSGAVIARAQDGEPLHVSIRVLGADGSPVEGAVVDVWQASAAGLYDVQDPLQPKGNLRARFRADADGRVEFWTVRPAPYPVPDDGPVGRMLDALGRHPWRAAHVHFRIWADGYRPLTTHLFDSASDYLDSDTVFGVKDSLIRTLDRVDGAPPAELGADATQHYRLTNDFVLAPHGSATSVVPAGPDAQHKPT